MCDVDRELSYLNYYNGALSHLFAWRFFTGRGYPSYLRKLRFRDGAESVLCGKRRRN